MKKIRFVIPLAASILLASCGGGEVASSSPIESVSTSSIGSSASSVSSSSSSSSNSSLSEITSSCEVSSSSEDSSSVAPSVSISEIEGYARGFLAKQSSISDGTIKKRTTSKYEDTTIDYTYTYGSDSNGDTLKVNDGSLDTFVMKDSSGAMVTVSKNTSGDYIKCGLEDSYSVMAPRFEEYIEGKVSYGAEGFFSDLVEMAKANMNKDFSAITKNGKIVFEFGYFEGDEKPLTFFKTSVSFAPNSEALTVLNLTISQYASSAFTYDETTKLVTLKEKATTSQVDVYKIAQNVGTRTYANDIDLASFEYQSLSFQDSKGNVVSEASPVKMKKGGYFPITLISSPSTASLRFDEPSIEVVSGGSSSAITGAFVRTNNGKKEELTIHAVEAGTFVVKVKTKNCSATFGVEAMDTKPTAISSRVYVEDTINDGYFSKKYSDNETITTYVGVSTYFSPCFQPSGCDASYTAKVKKSDGSKADKSSYTLNGEDTITIDDDDEVDVISFVGKSAGEYSLSISSEADSSIAQTYTLKVLEAKFANVLSSSYGYRENGMEGISYTFEFTPSSDNDLTGTISATDNSSGSVTNASYTISKVDGEDYYEFSFDSSTGFKLYIGSNYKLYTISNGHFCELYKSDSIDLLMPKQWEGCDVDGEYTVDSLKFYSDSTVSGSISDEDDDEYALDCEYSVSKNSDGTYTITFSDDGFVYGSSNDWFNSLPSTATLSADMDSITFNSDFFEADFTLSVVND